MSERDVGDPALGERADCTLDRLGAQPEMEPSLQAVDKGHPARGQRIVELARVMRHRGLLGVVACNLLLHLLEVAKHAMYVGVARRMVVTLVGVHLVERRVEDRERHADSPGAHQGDGRSRARVERLVVGDPAGHPNAERLQPVQ
ncbi:MAG TPA: hypothetical protein VE780_02110 [Thermoleophilaceae bacterium]|nr:hypothetical protein [Thermoleophilaceae bacterium]